MYGYYGIDWTYLVLVMPCILLSLWASANVKGTFNKYASVRNRRGLTGAEAARRVLSSNGVSGVQIGRISGSLTDHFDPTANIIRLSDDVYDSTSISAIGVACHEAGHAVQYAVHYSPMYIRAAIIPVTNFGTKLSIPMIMLGFLLTSMGHFSDVLVNMGILLFSLSVIFQLITLPVEFNASGRALRTIQDSQLLTQEEYQGARATLRAAALTYVAAAATAVAQLLRLILMANNRRRRD